MHVTECIFLNIFKEIHCTDIIYIVYKGKLEIFPVPSLNKYLQYGTSGTG